MELRKTLSEAKRERELLTYELHDIEAAALKPKEDEDLEEQISVMENAEQISEALSRAYEEVFSSDSSALSSLGDAADGLASIEGFSSDYKSLSEELKDIYYRTEDLKNRMRRLRDGASFSPDELDSAIERLETINALKRKYGGTLDAVLAYAAKAKSSLEALEDSDGRVKELEQKIQNARALYDDSAALLSSLRKKAAASLEEKITTELSELNFKNARFSVLLGKGPVSAEGTDTAEFLIRVVPIPLLSG